MLYHWILTLQFREHGGYGLRTMDGTIQVREGNTRTAVYANLVAAAYQKTGAPGNVLFFSLEPDRLAA